MSDTKRILSYVRRACDDYNMIEDGDRIAVGISGGKDSMTLLTALAEMRRFYPRRYELLGISIDMGFEGMDFTPIAEYCRELGVEYHLIPSDIAQVVFEYRREHNPCSLCAKMRRGAVNNAAARLGCNKVALGHHFDDVVETFMLNLFYEGRIGVFSPVTYLSRTNVTVIRPMIYMPEKDIRYFAKKEALPIVTSTCPADKNTEREEMKQFLARLDRENRGLKYRIYGAIQRREIDGFKDTGRRMSGIKIYSDDTDENQ